MYSGDFRSHGRKNFQTFLDKLPKKVDTLIIEGTNSGKDTINKSTISETALQRKITEEMIKSDKPVFVLVPTTNIDRIVGIYKASVTSGRELYVTTYQTHILEIMGGSVPRPTAFEKVKVYYPRKIKEKEFDDYIDLKNKSESINEIAIKKKFTMLVQNSTLGYIKKLASLREDKLKGATLIYSMWEGYKEKMQEFLATIDKMDIDIVTLHTSGHANSKAIELLKEKVKSRKIIVVHKP